jgi:hypothetical protein
VSENANDPVEQAGRVLLDALRITVGFSILAFQRVQVLRREIETELQRRFPKPQP